jgi:hypothetical protein
MLVIDGNGLPLGFHLDSATTAEVKPAEHTLDTISVARPRGRPKQRPKMLVADCGYDSRDFRHLLGRRGIRMCIPAKRRSTTWRAKRGRPIVARWEDYQLWYKVERSFAWLGNFRWLPIRWERHMMVYQGFFTVAVLLLCMRRRKAAPLTSAWVQTARPEDIDKLWRGEEQEKGTDFCV